MSTPQATTPSNAVEQDKANTARIREISSHLATIYSAIAVGKWVMYRKNSSDPWSILSPAQHTPKVEDVLGGAEYAVRAEEPSVIWAALCRDNPSKYEFTTDPNMKDEWLLRGVVHRFEHVGSSSGEHLTKHQP